MVGQYSSRIQFLKELTLDEIDDMLEELSMEVSYLETYKITVERVLSEDDLQKIDEEMNKRY